MHMYKIKYPNLFKPITLGKTLFRNRIFASPTGYLDLSPDRFPTAETIAYFELKARGGSASVCVGDCIVDTKTGQISSFQIHIDNPNALPSMSALANALVRHGAVAAVELNHGGIFSHYVYEMGLPLYGPSEMKVPDTHIVNNDGHEVKKSEDGMRHIHEMTQEQIYAVADAFGKAAAFAKKCGFGMITLHGGHGWLLAQFMSPFYNRRSDEWGGSTEKRMRMPLVVIESVRRAVGPGFPIEIRISGAECISGGYDIDEGIKIARLLDGKVDLIHVSAGHHDSPKASAITHPSMFLEDGCNVKYAAKIKKHVKTPVATVGALSAPELMEEIIASGKADVVQIGRGLLSDPDLPVKARMGLDEEINKCMRCYACFANSTARRQFYCAINPVIGHELENKFEIPPAAKKTVLVAGGGIAGMQAALTASQRGHRVILCEKSGRLGGVLRCEEAVPFKKKLSEYLDRQEMLISRSPIELRLNTQVTPQLAESIAPDVIIAAMGARPIRPNIPGIDRPNVLGAGEAYKKAGQIDLGKNIVILGGGLVGTELAIFLAQEDRSRKITIMEILDELNDGGNMVHAISLSAQIRELGISLALSTKALEINENGVIGDGPDGNKLYESDTVIYAVGQRPLREEANTLRFCAPEFHQIGDCNTPANILQATQAAYTIARDIGRF